MKAYRLLFAMLLALVMPGKMAADTGYAVFNEGTGTLTFYYDANQSSHTEGTTFDLNTGSNDPGWFAKHASITAVAFDPSFASARPTTTYRWFYEMTKLTSITGIGNLNTSAVTDMSAMFYNCEKLASLDVTHFNTANVTKMDNMFFRCRLLESLDLRNFNTANVTNMSSMFMNCVALASLKVSRFNTANVTTMGWMFYSCSALTSLDLSSFNTAKVTTMSSMFENCRALTTIFVGSGWNTGKVTSSGSMFSNCTALVGGSGTTYDANHTDVAYAHIDGGTSNKGYLTNGVKEAYGVWDAATSTLTHYYDVKKNQRTGDVIEGQTYDTGDVQEYPMSSSDVQKVVYDPSVADYPYNELCGGWFCTGMVNLITIEGLANVNTSEANYFSGMFSYCSSLTTLDLSSFDTRIATNMSNLFQGCISLQNLILGENFSTANVTDMSGLFSRNCNPEVINTILAHNGFTTENVTNMANMFIGYTRSNVLDLSTFNTAKVTNMKSMFEDCSSVTTIFVGSGWSTGAVNSSTYMFRGCTYLVGGSGTAYAANHTDAAYAHIDGGISNPGYFSKYSEAYAVLDGTTLTFYYDGQRDSRTGTTFDLNKGDNTPGWWYANRESITAVAFDPSFADARPTTTCRWFSSMSNLNNITHIEYLNTSAVTKMFRMFENCTSLEYIDVSHFNTENVTDMSFMFGGCGRLTSLDLSSFNTVNVVSMEGMFWYCISLTTIYAGDGWNTDNVTKSSGMFMNCTALVGGSGTTYNSNIIDKTYAHIDGGTSNPGYFSIKRYIEFADQQVKAFLTAPYIGIDTDGDGEISEQEAASLTDAEKIQDAFRQNSQLAATITSFDEFQYFTGLTEIPNGTFDYCTALKCIVLPPNITTIGTSAFSGCAALENIVLNEGLTTIESRAFEGYTGIITLPSTVTNIGGLAFENAAGLKVMWTTPPAAQNLIGTSQFGNNVSGKTLYVPIGSYDAYHIDYWWGFDIQEYGIINFADANVKAICVNNWDTDGDDELSVEEAVAVDSGHFNSLFKDKTGITSFDELKYFTGLTNIPESAFSGCTNLTSITLPRTVTEIQKYAFQGCSALTSIDIPEGVTTIGAQAFMSCSSLTELTMHYGLTTIGAKAFTGTQLERFYIPVSVTNMDNAFQAQTTVVPKYVTVELGEPIAITENTFPMRAQATLFVPEGFEEVYRNAPFWQDFGAIVAPIYFNDPAVKAICIANWDTNGDGELTKEEAAAVTTLGTAFKGNTEIRTFNELQYFTGLDDGSEYHNHVLTGDAFQGCSNLLDVTLPANITIILNRAFQGCTSLQYVYGMPDAVTNIYDQAFEGCSSLTNIQLPSSLRMISAYMFKDCSGLRLINIPAGVSYYGGAAFEGCTSLTRVTVNNPEPVVIGSTNDPFPTRENIILNVPAHSYDAYSTADYWKEFYNIQEREPEWLEYTDENGDIYQYEPGYSAQLSRYADRSGRTSFILPSMVTINGTSYPVTAIAGLKSGYLQTLIIPNGVQTVKDNAISCLIDPDQGLTLKEIYMRSPEPPTAGSQAEWVNNIAVYNMRMQMQYPDDPSKQVSLKDITLYVPTGSKALYEVADFWKEFTIEEYTPATAKAYALLSEDGKTFTFYNDGEKANRQGTTYELNEGYLSPDWAEWAIQTQIEKVVFDPSFANARPTSTYKWFKDMNSLTSIQGIENNLNTSEVTTMASMFYSCKKLETLDLSNFETDNVTDMNQMFYFCESLKSVDLSSFNTANVTNMNNMFCCCRSLKTLDLTSFNTVNVENMFQMFADCGELLAIYAGDGWSTAKLVTVDQYLSMFLLDSKLMGHKGTTYDEDITGKEYARIDGGSAAPGYLSYKPYALLSADQTSLTFYCDGQLSAKTGDAFDITDGTPKWLNYCSDIQTVTFDPSFAYIRPTNLYAWFNGMWALTAITGLENLNTSEVTNMGYMFANCINLENIDVSHFNTENVTNMSGLFGGCWILTSLDLSNFNTANVTNMRNMFFSCVALTTIFAGDGWNTDNVTSSDNMFFNCALLKGDNGTTWEEGNPTDKTYAHIDGGTSNPGYLSFKPYVVFADGTLTFYYDGQRDSRTGTKFDLNTGVNTPEWWANSESITAVAFDPSFADARPTTTCRWFSGMSNLNNITGIKYLNTSAVTNMMRMFENCKSLQYIDVSHFNTENVTDISFMFGSCEQLTSLDLSSFNTVNVVSMEGMFWSCSSLTTIYAGDGWNTGNVTKSSGMFMACEELKGDNGTTWNSSNPIDKTYAHLDGGTDNPGYFSVNLDFVKGDVNKDGSITIADVTALVNIILGKTTNYEIRLADVNEDGNVTIADVTALVNMILGKNY